MKKKRLSRKAKIRRVKRRRAKLLKRNHDVVGMINRSGAGAHKGSKPKEAKAPTKDDWNDS